MHRLWRQARALYQRYARPLCVRPSCTRHRVLRLRGCKAIPGWLIEPSRRLSACDKLVPARCGRGALKTLWWQGATLLNPHFAVGTKDQDGCRIFYEPLAAWDPDGALYPVLAAEIPDLENNGLAKDGKSVTWKLKQGVTWHDGKPFTADDVVFNWEYAKDPGTAATTSGSYSGIKVEKVD